MDASECTHVLVLCVGQQREELYQALLELSGLKTHISTQVPEFHDHLTSHHVDVAMLIADPDIALMHEVLSGLKSAGSEFRDLPVILVYPRETPVEVAVEALHSGAYDYLIEPFNEIEMLTKLVVLAKIKHVEDEFRQLAIKDRLTGLYDRRYLFIRFNEEMSRAKRYERPISCLVVDIDNFRAINEKYGIDAGDVLLQKVADLLFQAKREIDVLARSVDDEFVLALYNTDLTGAKVIGNRILNRIREIECPFDASCQVTASMGIAAIEANREMPMHAQELQRMAEVACIRSKQDGRNKFSIFTEDMADMLAKP